MQERPLRIGIMIGLILNLSLSHLCLPASARPVPPCTYDAPLPLDSDFEVRPVCLDDWIRNLDYLYRHLWSGSPGYFHETSAFPVLHDWGSEIGGYWIQDDQGRQSFLDVLYWGQLSFDNPALIAAIEPADLVAFQSMQGQGGIVIGRFWSAITSQPMGMIAILSSITDANSQIQTHLIPLDTVGTKVLNALDDSLFALAATPPFGVPWCECQNGHQFDDDEVNALNDCGSVIDAVYQTCSVNYMQEALVTAIAFSAMLLAFALCSGVAPAAFPLCMKAAAAAGGAVVTTLGAVVVTHILQCISDRYERRTEACTRACLGLPPC